MTTLGFICANDSAGNSVSTATVWYIDLVGRQAFQSAEVYAKTVLREAGTLQNMYLRVYINAQTATSTVVMRDNGVSVNETVSIGAAITGEFEDAVNQDTITAGHAYNFMLTRGDTTNNLGFSVLRTLFNATTNTVTRMCAPSGAGGTTWSAASTSYYFAPQGTVSALTSTEAGTKGRQLSAGTFQNAFIINGGGNTRTTATTFGSRIDTGTGSNNGNLIVSITAGQVGTWEDNVHTDSVASGNDYNFVITTGSDTGHQVTTGEMGASFVSTSGYTYLLASLANGYSPNNLTVKYYPLSGTFLAGTLTESIAQMKVGVEGKQFSKMTVFLTANSTGTSTMHFRKNAANGNQVVSVTASSTGNFTDSTNVDWLVSTDEADYSYTPGAASGVTLNIMESIAVKGTSIPVSETLTLLDH